MARQSAAGMLRMKEKGVGRRCFFFPSISIFVLQVIETASRALKMEGRKPERLENFAKSFKSEWPKFAANSLKGMKSDGPDPTEKSLTGPS